MNDFSWQCPICGSRAYQKYGGHVEKGIKICGENTTDIDVFVGRHFCCKGCSVFFSNPRIFNEDACQTSKYNNLVKQRKDVGYIT